MSVDAPGRDAPPASRGWRRTADRVAGTVRGSVLAAIGASRRTLARRTGSDVAAFAAAVGVSLFAGASLVGTRFALVATGAGIAGALAVVLLASRAPIVRALGAVVAVPVSIVVATPITVGSALAVGLTGLGLFAAVSVWALVLAGFGAALVSWDEVGSGGVRRGATGTTLAILGVLTVVALRILPEADAREQAGAAVADLAELGIEAIVSPDPAWALPSFFGLLFLAALVVPRAVGYLPLERLLPPDRHDDLSRSLSGLRRASSIAIRVAIVGGLASVLVPLVWDGIDDVPATPAALRAEVPGALGGLLAALVTAGAIRWLLLLALALAIALALAEWLRRALRKGLAGVLARAIAPAVGGAIVAVALARTAADSSIDAVLEGVLLAQGFPRPIVDLVEAVPTFAIAVAVLVVALSIFGSLLWTVTWLRIFRILPPRAIPASLAATAAFALAVVLAIVGRVEPAILTTAGAFVVWDVGEYGDTLRRELGRDAATLRAELVHAGGSVLSALLVAGATIGCYRWLFTESAVDPRLGAIGLGAGLVTVLLVAWALRG